MKKFISMFAFAAMIVLGAFALASCGGDDDDDPTPTPTPTPTPSTGGTYTFSVKVNKDYFESMKALYPDLAITYTIPGMDAKTVALTSEPINIEEKSSKGGRAAITFKVKLDTSKIDPTKTYNFDAVIVYNVVDGTKRADILNPNFSLTGQQVIELYSDLSEVVDLSYDL